MKANLTSLTLSTLMLISPAAFASEDAPSYEELRPTGRLDTSSKLVRTGSLPQINWEINYPLALTDLVDINPDDSVTPKTRTLMEVRVVGAAFQIGSNHTNIAVQSKVSGSSWSTLFNNNDRNVHPGNILMSRIVEPGQRIDFSARARKTNGGWYSSRNTLGNNATVQALTAGDYVPNYLPAYNQGDVTSFLGQYISGDDQVTIGPRDIIYLFELYSTNPDSSYFDMQDVVVVVSFKDVPED